MRELQWLSLREILILDNNKAVRETQHHRSNFPKLEGASSKSGVGNV